MTCSPCDLKDYFFGELNAADRELVEKHLAVCSACADEVALLGATRTAVLCMREEEPPRRIAFVSDKVFEPRWWQKIWQSVPQLGFASAALLAAAIFFHAVYTPAAPMEQKAAVAQADPKIIEAEVAKRLQAAVMQAVAEQDARRTGQILKVVNDRLAQSERRYELDLKTVAEYLDRMDKRQSVVRRTAFDGVLQ